MIQKKNTNFNYLHDKKNFAQKIPLNGVYDKQLHTKLLKFTSTRVDNAIMPRIIFKYA